jgi:hypothetical protein
VHSSNRIGEEAANERATQLKNALGAPHAIAAYHVMQPLMQTVNQIAIQTSNEKRAIRVARVRAGVEAGVTVLTAITVGALIEGQMEAGTEAEAEATVAAGVEAEPGAKAEVSAEVKVGRGVFPEAAAQTAREARDSFWLLRAQHWTLALQSQKMLFKTQQ